MIKQFKLKPLVAVLGGAALVLSATSAVAQIAGTRHNLGSSNVSSATSAMNFTTATAEICVFCHTPHGAAAGTTGTGDPYAPLWNKGLSQAASNTYNTYSSNTLDAAYATDGKGSSSGGTTTAGAIGSVSLACLSCHDGTQAMDNMINQPGFGGYNGSGARYNPAGSTWSGPRVSLANGTINNDTAGGTGIAQIGTNLADDHPIGIVYCASTSDFTASSITCNDKDFNIPTNATFGAQRRWWIDTNYSQLITVKSSSGSQAISVGNNANTRERTDIMLYNRTVSGARVVATVECASCHDPHVAPKATNQTAFLRVSQAGSGVCLACHAK